MAKTAEVTPDPRILSPLGWLEVYDECIQALRAASPKTWCSDDYAYHDPDDDESSNPESETYNMIPAPEERESLNVLSLVPDEFLTAEGKRRRETGWVAPEVFKSWRLSARAIAKWALENYGSHITLEGVNAALKKLGLRQLVQANAATVNARVDLTVTTQDGNSKFSSAHNAENVLRELLPPVLAELEGCKIAVSYVRVTGPVERLAEFSDAPE